MKWSDENYVEAYRLSLTGMTDNKIGHAIGVTAATFVSWKKKYPALKKAITLARTKKSKAGTRDGGITLDEFIFDKLEPETKKTWDEISKYDKEPNAKYKLREVYGNMAIATRQHLFLYALYASNFHVTEACKKVNISRGTYDNWRFNDKNFDALVKEIEQIKKDFFENGLVELVDKGHAPAVIFANRTYNKDRGYGDKLEIEHGGSIDHRHVVSMKELDLPLATRRVILDAMRKIRVQDMEPSENRIGTLAN